jgi:hypothetical protein
MRPAVRVCAPLFFSMFVSLDASAQRAVLAGVVLEDSSEKPLAFAEVAIPTLKLSTRTNAAGEFRLTNISAGTYVVLVRQIGYAPLFANVKFADSGTVETDFLMVRRVVMLDTITATENVPAAKMRGFEERRAMGIGHFITRSELEKQESRRMSDVVTQVPGARVIRTSDGAGFVANARGMATITNERRPDPAESRRRRSPIPPACYSNVYVDGVQVYSGKTQQPLFDINSLGPNQIEGVEYYAGGTQVPAQYGGSDAACGVLLIWTRISK